MPDCPGRLTETETWVSSTGFRRRQVLMGGAALAGYALACQPVSATTITTPDDGLDTAMVGVMAPDGFTLRAYVAHPRGPGPHPVIIVVHEIFGLHEWVQDMCRRYARAGYYAIAPDLFQRVGDASKVADIKTLVETIVTKTPDAAVLADLDAVAAYAGSHGGDAKRLGLTGYCWGGRIAWLYAEHAPALKAAVACYGGLVASPRNPVGVVDHVADLKAPVLGQYGGKDAGIPPADIAAMRAALAEVATPSRIDVFPDAGHGFLADYRPSYDEPAAKKAFADGLAWFKRYL